MAANYGSGDATKEGKENTHNADDKQLPNNDHDSGVYHTEKPNDETHNDEDSEGAHSLQKTDKCLCRVDFQATSDVKTGSYVRKTFGKQLGSFIGKAKSAVSDLASQEVCGDYRKRRGRKRMSIIMKMMLVVKEDSDEKSSGASDDDESEYFRPIEADEGGNVDNEEPLSPKEERKKATEVAAQESKVVEHDKELRQQMTEEEEQDLTSLSKKKEEETKEKTQQALQQVLKLEEAMATEGSFTADTPSIMQTALLEVSQKEADAANNGAEEKSQQHEKEEEEQVRNEEEKEDGEMRKRKREDEAASEPVVDNAIAPDDVLKMAVNSNKKHKTEDGDDDNVKNRDMGRILQHEKAAASHGRQDTRSARRKAKRAEKKAQRQEIKPKEVVRTGIVGDEFDSLLLSGANDAFLKTVDEVRESLRKNPPLLHLKPVSIFQGGGIKCALDVAECIPVAKFSILCLDFDEDKLPPPSVRTVYALMALTLSTMESKSLFRDNNDNKQTALAYVLLKIIKLCLRSGNAIMNELSKYYALLFGKRTLGFVIGGQSIHHQEQQEEGQPPILDGLFDYYSGCPVTVCNWNSTECYYSDRKPILGLRVAHQIQNEKSKYYYVYKVKEQTDSAYAVLRTLLNPLFLSNRWTSVLLDGVPQNLQCKVKEVYKDAIFHACTCKQYLKATYRWLQPAIAKSAGKLLTAYQTSTVANEFVGARKKSRMDTSRNEVSQMKKQLREPQEQEKNQLEEERIIAYSVIRSRLPEGHSLHEVIASECGEKMAVTCDRNDMLVNMLKVSLDDEQNYSVYLGIAEGRLKVRQWISSKVPSVKGSDSDIYEKVHPSEAYYRDLYLSFGIEEKNSKVSDEALDYAIFTPDGADKVTGVEADLVQRGTAQFVYYILCQYMNPPDEGYNIDDGSAVTVLTDPSKGSRKIKLRFMGRKFVFVFWCSDEKLIREWYNTLCIVLRLHVVKRPHKIESTNKVELRSVQPVGVNDKLVVNAEPGTLGIYFAVSEEAPTVDKRQWCKYDSLYVIKLNSLPLEGSNPEKKTTAVMCPRSVMNCIRNLPPLRMLNKFLILHMYGSEEMDVKQVMQMYHYFSTATSGEHRMSLETEVNDGNSFERSESFADSVVESEQTNSVNMIDVSSGASYEKSKDDNSFC